MKGRTLTRSGYPKLGFGIKEACEITGLGRTTLYEAIADGKLARYKVGRRTLFSLKHLEDFMLLHDSNSKPGEVKQ